jgi:macrolide transport system ATP-binding/permease protein
MGILLEDLRFAFRSLGKNPSFTALAVTSLALGIGANTTIFTLVNALFLRPLPVERPETLVSIYTRDPKNPGMLPSSYPNFRDYRDHNQVFSSLLLYTSLGLSLTGRGDPTPLLGQIVSGDYFSTLGVRMALGRGFTPDEDRVPGANPVAVISYGLWTRHFAADPHVLGQTVHINGWPYRVVGVTEPQFHGLNSLLVADAWVPSMMYQRVLPTVGWFDRRRALLFSIVGRLKPGVRLEQAQAAMQGVALELDRRYPQDNQGRTVSLLPLTEAAIHPNVRSNVAHAGALLVTISGLVLLIACANVANLLLVRAAGRSREIAIRVALGASRWQILRQLLTESALLSLAAGALGIFFARWARDVLWSARPPMLNSLDYRVEIDARVLGFAVAVSVITGLLFGLAPALRATRPDLVAELKDRAGQTAPKGPWRSRSVLLVAQVALSMVALIGAGLFVRSLSYAQHIDPGFRTENLVMVQFNLNSQGYSEARGREFQQQLLERTSRLPGVLAASLASRAPFSGGISRTVLLQGDENTATGRGRITLACAITPGFLQTMGIPLVRGRDFSRLDQPGTPRMAIVNEVMASRYWPGENAIGKRFFFFGEKAPLEVAGIARTANYLALGEAAQPMVYVSMLQTWTPVAVVHAAVMGDPGTALAAIKREIQASDGNLLLEGESMPHLLHNSLWAPRLAAGLLGAFGVLALLLAAVGIYGTVSYSVSQRVREIGVRMALGATARDVQLMVVWEGARLVVVGVVCGCAAAVGVSRLVQNLLFGISATDGPTFVLVPLTLVAVAVVACWLPARRATRVDPLLALRYE